MELKKKILKYALQNAIKFDGNANQGAVIGKILAEEPELKAKIKEISKDISEVIKEVNKLKVDEQTKKLKAIAPELLEKSRHEKKSQIKELKNTKDMIMRFEPSPSGPLHIGHAYVLSLNSEYCRKYNGKLILRISDTNPDNIYEPAYKMIEEEARWITKNNISEVFIQSDRVKIYYEYMENLIELEKVYICTCNQEKFKELISNSMPCPCRELPKEEQKERWKNMFTKYKKGDAVARCKTDIYDKNPAMRDFPIFRINESEHPRHGKKVRVWPLMNMAVMADDIEMKITHVIRAKDHVDNAKRQEIMYNYLMKEFPDALFVGRINFENMSLSTTEIKEGIKNKKYNGWDDIRLPTLAALRRRGFAPDSLIKYSLDVGVTLNDKLVTKEEFFKSINAFNREVIDGSSFRYFFIENPKKIKIENAPEQDIELDLHPDKRKKGRKFNSKEIFYVTNEDFKNFKNNKLYRLMDCLNFIKKENKFVFDSLDYKKFKDKGEKIIHWLPECELINVEVLMPDGTIKKGLGESNLKDLKEGDIIQFERFGFARLDKKRKDKFIFWFTHN